MINLFLVYIALCIFQDNYLPHKELLLTVSQIKDYCSFDSMVSNCVSAMDIQSLVNSEYSGEISVKVYSKFFIYIKYLKYLLLALNVILLFVFCLRKKDSGSAEAGKLSFGLVGLFSLLASYKFIYLYSNNITLIPFKYIAIVTLLSCFIFILIFYLMKFLSKDIKTAVLFGLYFCFLIYNTNYVNITYIQIFNLLFVSVLMLTSDNILKFLKVFTITLFCLCAVNVGYKAVKQFDFKFNDNKAPKTDAPILKFTKTPKNNIYIFVFDMYGGSESLEKIYGFDNSPFMRELRKQGFYVRENMISNYNRTLFTFSTCLNFKYLDDIEEETPTEAISYSEFFKIAKKLSYKIFYFNSYPAGMTAVEDIIDYSFTTENKIYLIAQLFFNNTIFFSSINELFYYGDKNVVFSTCYNIVKYYPKSDKKLLFFHFLMPHNPFLYDENETKYKDCYQEFKTTDDVQLINKERYIQYLKYTNKRILELIRFIKENDKNDPIIIVMGDHGSRAKTFIKNQKKHLGEMDRYYLLSHFNTFLAYYNKNSDYSAYKEDDLLNFFINFSNEIFGTDIKILKRRNYYSDLVIPIVKMKETENIEFDY